MLRQDNGNLACVAECEKRYTLQDVKDEMMAAMGLDTEEKDSAQYKARQGFKRSTWWEEDEETETYDLWRY